MDVMGKVKVADVGAIICLSVWSRLLASKRFWVMGLLLSFGGSSLMAQQAPQRDVRESVNETSTDISSSLASGNLIPLTSNRKIMDSPPDPGPNNFHIITGVQGCANQGLRDFWDKNSYYDVYTLKLADHILAGRSIPISGHNYGSTILTKSVKKVINLEDQDLTAEQREELAGKVRLSLIYWTTAQHEDKKVITKSHKDHPYLGSMSPSHYDKEYLEDLMDGSYAKNVQTGYHKVLQKSTPDSVADAKNFSLGDSKARISLPLVVGKKGGKGVARFNTIGYGLDTTNLGEFTLVPAVEEFEMGGKTHNQVTDAWLKETFNMTRAQLKEKPRVFNKVTLKRYTDTTFKESRVWQAKSLKDLEGDEPAQKTFLKDSYSFGGLKDDDQLEVPPIYVTHFAVQMCRDYKRSTEEKKAIDNLMALDVIKDLEQMASSGGVNSTKIAIRTSRPKVSLKNFYAPLVKSDKDHLEAFKQRADDLGLGKDLAGNYISAFYWKRLYIQRVLEQIEFIEKVQFPNGLPSGSILSGLGKCNATRVVNLYPPGSRLHSCLPRGTCGTPREVKEFRRDTHCEKFKRMVDYVKSYTKELVANLDSGGDKMQVASLRLATLNVSKDIDEGKVGDGIHNRNTLKYGGLSGESHVTDFQSVPTLYKGLSCFDIRNSIGKLLNSYADSSGNFAPSAQTLSYEVGGFNGEGESYTKTVKTNTVYANPMYIDSNTTDQTHKYILDNFRGSSTRDIPYVANSHKWWEHTDLGSTCGLLEDKLLNDTSLDRVKTLVRGGSSDPDSSFDGHGLFDRLTGLVFHEWQKAGSITDVGPFTGILHTDDGAKKFLQNWKNNKDYLKKVESILSEVIQFENLEILLNLQPHYNKSCTFEHVASVSQQAPGGWGNMQSSAVLDAVQDFGNSYDPQEDYYSKHVEGDFAINPARDAMYRNPNFFVFASSPPQNPETNVGDVGLPMLWFPASPKPFTQPRIFLTVHEDRSNAGGMLVTSRPRAHCIQRHTEGVTLQRTGTWSADNRCNLDFGAVSPTPFRKRVLGHVQDEVAKAVIADSTAEARGILEDLHKYLMEEKSRPGKIISRIPSVDTMMNCRDNEYGFHIHN